MLNELCKLSELNDQQKHEESGEKEEWVDPTHTINIVSHFHLINHLHRQQYLLFRSPLFAVSQCLISDSGRIRTFSRKILLGTGST
jgi:hypothetical protein